MKQVIQKIISELKEIGFRKSNEIEDGSDSYSYILKKIYYGRKHTFSIIFREKNNKLRWYLFSKVGTKKTESERYKDSFILLSDDNLEKNHFSMRDGTEDINYYPKLKEKLNIISKGIVVKRKKEIKQGFSADLENLSLGDKLYYISKEYGLWEVIKINQKTVSIKNGNQIKTKVLPSWLIYPEKTISNTKKMNNYHYFKEASMENIEKEIRHSWFGKHVAEYKELNDGINILDWKEPGTICFGVRYVFDGRYLYISGDLGEAVFTLTWNGNPKSFLDVNPHYFHEKLSAYRGNDEYDYDSGEARKRLEEEIMLLKDDYDPDEIDEEHLKILEEMKNLTGSCSTNKEWEFKIAYETDLFERLQNHDIDCWEWIFRVGEVIPTRIKSYLIGLKMAAKQLEGE